MTLLRGGLSFRKSYREMERMINSNTLHPRVHHHIHSFVSPFRSPAHHMPASVLGSRETAKYGWVTPLHLLNTWSKACPSTQYLFLPAPKTGVEGKQLLRVKPVTDQNENATRRDRGRTLGHKVGCGRDVGFGVGSPSVGSHYSPSPAVPGG
jgi:hypothetical protein